MLQLPSIRRRRISIHSLRMEGDDHGVTSARVNAISIHSLRMEGDQLGVIRIKPYMGISIHSLRMEGDRCSLSSSCP